MKTINYRFGVLLLFVIFSIILGGCGNKQQEAKDQLVKLKVEYTEAAFIQAVEENQQKEIELFLTAGMNLISKNDAGETVFMAAAKAGNTRLLNHIFKEDNNCLNLIDNAGKSALFYAISAGQSDALNLLSTMGVEWKLVDQEGDTPLHVAILVKNNEAAKLAIDQGAEVNAKTKAGKTALQLAHETQNEELLNYLKAHGAKDEEEEALQRMMNIMSHFYGEWYMEGQDMAHSGHMIINETEIIHIPLHDLARIPKSTYKRNTYNIINGNFDSSIGKGYVLLKLDDGSLQRFTLYSLNILNWEKYNRYNWKKLSDKTTP